MTWLWLGLSAITLVLALWPFGFYQASLIIASRLRRFPKAPVAQNDGSKESFAVLICAHNEARCIKAKIEDLLRLRDAAGGQLEILVYVDGATDGTDRIVEDYKDQIRLFVSKTNHGKTHGMNLLIRETDASIAVFTDANVMVGQDAISVLRRYFADPLIGCVCSNLSYTNPDDSETAQVGSSYWGFNEWSKSLETATGSVIGADGSLFAMRRHLYRPAPDGLIDDIYVSFQVLFQGQRVVRAPELFAFEHHTTKAGDEFRRKVRIACECMHVHFRTWPDWKKSGAWNLYKYVGHRLLRWLGGYLLVLSALFGFLAFGSALGFGPAILLTAVALLMFTILVKIEWSPVLKIWNAILAFAGVSLGVWQAFRGQRAITWSVPESARQALAANPGRMA